VTNCSIILLRILSSNKYYSPIAFLHY